MNQGAPNPAFGGGIQYGANPEMAVVADQQSTGFGTGFGANQYAAPSAWNGSAGQYGASFGMAGDYDPYNVSPSFNGGAAQYSAGNEPYYAPPDPDMSADQYDAGTDQYNTSPTAGMSAANPYGAASGMGGVGGNASRQSFFPHPDKSALDIEEMSQYGEGSGNGGTSNMYGTNGLPPVASY